MLIKPELFYLFESYESYTIGDLKTSLLLRAKNIEAQEYARKVTLFGPHLDDLVFSLNNFNAKTHASRGQMRALVLSFNLAVMTTICNIRNTKPIILSLDDIISELDSHKKNNLTRVISRLEVQAFFSATEPSAFCNTKINQKFSRYLTAKL